MVQNKRYAVFSIRKVSEGNTVWVRAGSAWLNKDDSMNVYLDVLPLDGKLHVREPGERREYAGSTVPPVPPPQAPSPQPQVNVVALESMGGH